MGGDDLAEGARGRVVVLGGYGAAGERLVDELLETTACSILLAGRSVQRAERSALPRGDRVAGGYLDAADSRTLGQALETADLVVGCTTGRPLAAIEACIERRVPFASLTSLPLGDSTQRLLDERAFEASTPVMLNAGAAPGLAGVLADALVRRFEPLAEIRVACSGPWLGTAGARADVEAARVELKPTSAGRAPTFAFPSPIGRRLVRPLRALDLEAFVATHDVGAAHYLESSARLGRVARWVGREPGDSTGGFALVAEASRELGARTPDARISLLAEDAATLAITHLAAQARALLTRPGYAGLLQPFELLNPTELLGTLAARGAELQIEPRD